MEELKACNFTKSNTPPWVFFVIFKLYKWYQIAQTSYMMSKTQYQYGYLRQIQVISPLGR